MTPAIEQLQAAIQSLEAQREVLGDTVMQAALAPLRQRLAELLDAPMVAPLVEPAAAERPAQVLRQVSILFVDVVGSTALSQHLEPEDVSAVLDHALQRATAIVQQHRGRVLQYAGDNLLAAFGSEDVAEDDAECAVHGGLALLALGRALAAEVLAAHGRSGVDVRVGIHTGRVLLGGGVDEEDSIRGLAVNIAARMEQTAPPGTLRISHDTWLLVRGVFDVLVQPLLQVKGHDEPIVSYLVERARPRAFRIPSRGIDGLATPMVGRGAEFVRLLDLLGEVIKQRLPRAATLIGEPGLGKSRLLQELQTAIDQHEQPFWLLLGRSHPSSHLQPYGLLRDLLAWRLQIDDGDSAEAAKAALVSGMLPFLGAAAADDRGEGGDLGDKQKGIAEAKVHRIGHLIGFDFSASPHVRGVDPAALRSMAFAALHDYLGAVSEHSGGAVALLLEDLHWVDDASLTFIEELLARASGALLIVATARPLLLERRPAWGVGAASHHRIALQALDAAQSVALASALLTRLAPTVPGVPEAPDVQALHQMVIARSDGNPFYMEELVRMLLQDSVIEIDTTTGRWQVRPDRLQHAELPTTLVGVLQARLARLPPAERQALQHASIVGPVFWDQALAALDAHAVTALPALQHRMLVHARGHSSFDGTTERSFHHQLLQQVTYGTVLKPMRRAGHAAAARWLADRLSDRHAPYLAVAGQHYERAGDTAKALDFYERAAADAQQRCANDAAWQYVELALQCPEAADSRVRDRLLNTLTDLADLTGDRDRQAGLIEQRRAIAEALDDDGLRARVLWAQATLASRRSDEQLAFDLAAQALRIATRAHDVPTQIRARSQMAWGHYAQRRIADADAQIRIAIEQAKALVAMPDSTSDPMLLIQPLTILGIVCVRKDSLAEAHVAFSEALQCAAVAGALRSQVSIRNNMGLLAIAGGELQQAAASFVEGARQAEQIGFLVGAANGHANAAHLFIQLDQDQQALEHLAAAQSAAVRSQYREAEGYGWLLQGEIASRAGDFAAAHGALQHAARILDAIGHPHYRCNVRAETALLHLKQGQLQLAIAEAEQIDAEWPQLNLSSVDTLQLLMACHHVWLAAGDPRAATGIEALHADLQAHVARCADPAVRKRLLQEVPLHCEVVEAWRAQQARELIRKG